MKLSLPEKLQGLKELRNISEGKDRLTKTKNQDNLQQQCIKALWHTFLTKN